ncbi:unnamed protein product [Brassica oleracea var. botrytis]|uniref:Uncharacterized protein n=1 Tax=Brassica oleracea TaxID=3712 RepID=A0A3P6ELM2_BRAOL|nr:unnamed protein product [Brassica oleracea]
MSRYCSIYLRSNFLRKTNRLIPLISSVLFWSHFFLQPVMKSWSMLPLSTSRNSCSGSLSIFKHLLTRTWNSQML